MHIDFVMCKKKLKGDPLETWKISQKKILNETFESATVPKNVKGGTICDFLTSIVLQNDRMSILKIVYDKNWTYICEKQLGLHVNKASILHGDFQFRIRIWMQAKLSANK